MESLFTSDFFVANRQQLRNLFTGKAPIVITANGVLQRGGDNNYPFAQDANFWYLTGLEYPDLILVMDKDKEYLIIPNRETSHEAFNGVVSPEEVKRRSGIDAILGEKAGWDQLSSRLKKVKHIATLAPPAAYIEAYGLYTNPARATLIAKLKTYKNDLELLDLSPHMIRLRMIKQPEELLAIQKAIDVTIASFKKALTTAKLKKYAHEYEIEAELSREFRRRGAHGHAFAPVIAGGANAVTLHNIANNSPLATNELIVIDIGAEIEHYAADITRTISLKPASRRQRDVYNAVLAVQQFAISLLKPGVLLKQYEDAIEQFMGEKLRELNLIKTISHEAVRYFFPHATSHFLGLNVHDVGDYQRPLEPGMVLTVEPGIYISAESLGVRIEDDVLITASGHKILSKKLSHLLQ